MDLYLNKIYLILSKEEANILQLENNSYIKIFFKEDYPLIKEV
jgi:hypothetical protein